MLLIFGVMKLPAERAMSLQHRQLQFGDIVTLDLREKMLPAVLLERRLHGANQGVLKRGDYGEYIHVLKQVLDRGREAQAKLT